MVTKINTKLNDIVLILLLNLFIIIIWCYIFGFFHGTSWNFPTGYGGDLFWVLAMAKSYMTNEVFPFLYKEMNFLNAPYKANWSDVPITEEFIFMSIGYLAKITNIYFAHNIVLLLAHCLAGSSFFIVARLLNCKKFNSFVFSSIFALFHFLFLRGSAHIILTYVFLIPPSIYILLSVYLEKSNLKDSKLKILTSFFIGTFNPYYTFIYCKFLFFIFIFKYLKNSKLDYLIILLLAASISGFLLVNFDTIYSILKNGINSESIGRNLAALEVYGMKLPEFFFPPSGHRLEFLSHFSKNHYYHQAFVRGESWSSYMGFLGIFSFSLLILNSLKSIRFGWKYEEILTLISINWILLYSLIGGLALLLGVFEFQIFRASNRFSIIIFCILLVYTCIKTSRIKNIYSRYLLLLIILVVSLLDYLPKPNFSFQNPIKKTVNEDILMGKILMEKLSPGDKIFQLPFAKFPEVGPINKMSDYEHFRPYINTYNLHFSYGNNKGRGIEEWQEGIKFTQDSNFNKKLTELGFKAIYINKKGYKKLDLDILISIFSQNDFQIIFETADIVIYKLKF